MTRRAAIASLMAMNHRTIIRPLYALTLAAVVAPAAPSHAQTPIALDAVATYESHLNRAPAVFATIAIDTCDSSVASNGGMNGPVRIVIRDKKSEHVKSYYLDNPGNDRRVGQRDEYAFEFPGSTIGSLHSFELV